MDPVNTDGCGDSMIGGFAIGCARGWLAEETLRYGRIRRERSFHVHRQL